MKMRFQFRWGFVLCLAAFACVGFEATCQESALPADALKLKDFRDRKVKEVNRIYVQELLRLRAKLNKEGDIDGALAADAAIKKVDPALVDLGNGKPQPPEQLADVFLICDNVFDFHVNGAAVVSGESRGMPTQKQVALRRGDVITVKISNTGSGYGFACIIKRPGKDPIVSNLDDWRCYDPKDLKRWSDPNSVGRKHRVEEGNNKVWKTKIEFEANAECMSIWSAERGGTGYLIYEIED